MATLGEQLWRSDDGKTAAIRLISLNQCATCARKGGLDPMKSVLLALSVLLLVVSGCSSTFKITQPQRNEAAPIPVYVVITWNGVLDDSTFAVTLDPGVGVGGRGTQLYPALNPNNPQFVPNDSAGQATGCVGQIPAGGTQHVVQVTGTLQDFWFWPVSHEESASVTFSGGPPGNCPR
jgi:hypothetical protein